MNRLFMRLLLVLLGIAAAISCERRPLEDPSGMIQIKIKVNVNAITNVNTNIRNSVHLYGTNTSLWDEKLDQLDPEMMRVLVYDPYTDKLLTQSFVSSSHVDKDGDKVFEGNLGISHGYYNFLVYNFDTPTTQVTSENSESSIIAYTDEISPAMRAKYMGVRGGIDEPDPYEDVHIHYEPEHLLVANQRGVRISPHDTLVIVRTEASTVVDTYYLQVRVEGLQFASSATAVISGLSPSNKIGLNKRVDEPSSAVIFDLQKAQDLSLEGENKDVLCAVFNTFGKIRNSESKLYVTFNVYDTAGNLLKYTADMDSIFDTELAREKHWLIIDDSYFQIVIPDPGVNPPTPPSGGGFQPQVDDWEEETGEITI